MNPLKIRPYGDMVLIKEDGWDSVSDAGIILHQVETPTWLTGKVVRVGPGKPNERGIARPPGYNHTPDDPETHRPNGYQEGDRVTYSRGSGMDLGDGYAMLAAHQILPALLPDGFIRLENPYRKHD